MKNQIFPNRSLQATGVRIGTMLQNFSNLGVGIILSFIYGWALTLLILAFIPFMIIAGFLQTYLLTGFSTNVSCHEYFENDFLMRLIF